MNRAREIEMRIGLAVTMLVVAMGGSSVTAQVTTDSTTWEGFYEADVKPVTAGWVDLYGGNANCTVTPDPCDAGNNYIHVVSQSLYEGFGWHEDPGDFDPSTNGGISLELRMRVASGNFFCHMWPSAVGSARWLSTSVFHPGYVSPPDWNILPDQAITVLIRDSDQYDPAWVAIDPNDADFHIYRITCDDAVWNLYRYQDNDDPCYSAWITTPVVGAEASDTGYVLDLYGELEDTVFDLDYIRWTDQGALLPGSPSQCAEPGTEFRQTDIDDDCYVNTGDLALFAAEWLDCTNPADPTCDP